MAGGNSGRRGDLILDNAAGHVASRRGGLGAAVCSWLSVHVESVVGVAFNSEKQSTDDAGL